MKYPALLYADDTLLIAKHHIEMQKLLNVVVLHSEQYNLKLNYSKCQLLVIGPQGGGEVRFPDNSVIPPSPRISYLGTTFTFDASALA
eukprot:6484562-Amphidinium_carterae.1